MRPTPGPWAAERDQDGGVWVTGPDREAPVVCDVQACDHRLPCQGEEWANAQLIAAAPDHQLLLAALVSGRAEKCGFIGDAVMVRTRGSEMWMDVDLDPFGCPVLSDTLRAELLKRAGEEPGG